MKTHFVALTFGLLLTGSLTGCSLLPNSAEPEIGSALASSIDSPDRTSLTVNGVLFDFEKTALNPGADEIVLRAVDYLQSNPGSQAMVEGHTDHIGSKRFNQKLSEKRAHSIVKALTSNGISSDRITAVGYGESRPLADNSTADGRRANRRVEIILHN